MEKVSRLGRMLLEARLITEEQLKMAVDFQKAVGGKIAAIIVKLGFIEEATLTSFIAKTQGLKVVNLEEIVLPENLIKRIPRKLMERHHVIPIQYKDGVLTVATSDPYDYEAMGELQLAQDARIEITLAPRSQILRCISSLFPDDVATRERPRSEHGEPRSVSKAFLHEAVIPLLIEKGLITEEELLRKARQLEAESAKERI